MMLSRVADHLYWLSRYLERAEHTARLLDVNFDLMPDRSAEARRRAWEKLFASLRLPAPASSLSAYELTQRLTFDASNEGSIIYNIAAARENARQVREQISSEMWEQINRLYLELKNRTIDQIWQTQPHEFFQMVKQGAHLFQGISDSTMNHGEGWRFIQVGQFIERVGNVAALLHVHLSELSTGPQPTQSADQYLDWVGILRSCTAFEAYCKVYTADLQYHQVIEFLLLNEEFPHSIHFSIKMMRAALNAIAETTDTRKNSQVYRQIGRLQAMLDFDQIDEIIAGDLHAYLNNIQRQCSQIHTTIYQTYISYPANEKLAA
jgi:uncharacterized alpha-E superfamily protein